MDPSAPSLPALDTPALDTPSLDSPSFDTPGFERTAPTVAVRTGPADRDLPPDTARDSTAREKPEPAEHQLFRATTAFGHDTRRPPIDVERVVGDWMLMHDWLDREPELAAVCGFSTDDLGQAARRRRIADLVAEVGPGRTFEVLPAEMQFWVRYAWINAERCSGRQHALQAAVIQHRPEVRSGVEMLRAVLDHASVAMSAPVPPQTTISVLGGPVAPGTPGPLFLTDQMLRPAGYRTGPDTWLGDGGYLDVTDWVRANGGSALITPTPGYRPGTFDTLPMVAAGEDGGLVMARVPERSRYLIDIPWPRHPESEESSDDAGFGEPFACWPAIPLQTNFTLDISGQRYCLIFNGWYVDEEMVTNYLDQHRYNWADRISEAIHGPVDRQMLARTDRFDEYRMAQVEIATLRAIRAGFKQSRMKLNTLSSSQNGFAKFCQRYLDTHGQMPPNDTGWTANRVGSRFRYPSHPVPHTAQERGASLHKNWMSVRSVRPEAPVQIADLDELDPIRAGRHAAGLQAQRPVWTDDLPMEEARGCPVAHARPPR